MSKWKHHSELFHVSTHRTIAILLRHVCFTWNNSTKNEDTNAIAKIAPLLVVLLPAKNEKEVSYTLPLPGVADGITALPLSRSRTSFASLKRSKRYGVSLLFLLLLLKRKIELKKCTQKIKNEIAEIRLCAGIGQCAWWAKTVLTPEKTGLCNPSCSGQRNAVKVDRLKSDLTVTRVSLMMRDTEIRGKRQ